MVSAVGRARPWLSAGSVLLFAGLLGCGNIYRPVVTSIPPNQPGTQPTKYAVVISCGSRANTLAPSIDQVCAGSTAPGHAALVDFSGDSLTSQIDVGTGGPRWLSLSSTGATAYLTNTDGTVNSFTLPLTSGSPPLENNSVNTSTLLSNAQPDTLLWIGNEIYVTQPGRNSIGVLNASGSGAPTQFLEIPITDPNAPTVNQHPVNMVGNTNTLRVYAISQGANGCPGSTTNGFVTGIETSTSTISSVLPVGVCPVYGVMSSDDRRTFILNNGSGTITVIDSQQNRIDPNFPNGIAVGQGPVWADIYNNGSILAVANSVSGTLSLINISLDSFGHDSPNFGQIIATVPVGPNPSSVAILQDGTRAYVANRNDPANGNVPPTDKMNYPKFNGSLSVVNLTNDTVTSTVAMPQQPCTGNPTVLCNVHPLSIAATTGTPTGKVYVVSPETNILTILRTDNDTVYQNLPLTGDGVQVRVTAP